MPQPIKGKTSRKREELLRLTRTSRTGRLPRLTGTTRMRSGGQAYIRVCGEGTSEEEELASIQRTLEIELTLKDGFAFSSWFKKESGIALLMGKLDEKQPEWAQSELLHQGKPQRLLGCPAGLGHEEVRHGSTQSAR